MALLKKITLETGYEAEYWKVTGVIIDFEMHRAQISFAIYKDKIAKDEGKKPVIRKAIAFLEKNFPFTIADMDKKNVIALAYDASKADPQLTGSTDI